MVTSKKYGRTITPKFQRPFSSCSCSSQGHEMNNYVSFTLKRALTTTGPNQIQTTGRDNKDPVLLHRISLCKRSCAERSLLSPTTCSSLCAFYCSTRYTCPGNTHRSVVLPSPHVNTDLKEAWAADASCTKHTKHTQHTPPGAAASVPSPAPCHR